MSVIRKTPYIESVIGNLEKSDIEALVTVLNSGGNNVNVSLLDGSLDDITDAITPVYMELANNKCYSGILILTDYHCCLVAYHRFQDLKLFDINTTTKTYKEINEYCDINELRRIVANVGGGGGGEISPEALAEVLEGSETVVVDLNEAGTKLEVRLDNDYKNKCDKALQIPVTTRTNPILVGVSTGNEQLNVEIASWSGLEIFNNVLKVQQSKFANREGSSFDPNIHSLREYSTYYGSSALPIPTGDFEIQLMGFNVQGLVEYVMRNIYVSNGTKLIFNRKIDGFATNDDSIVSHSTTTDSTTITFGTGAANHTFELSITSQGIVVYVW